MTATTAPTPARPDVRGPAGAYPRRVAEARSVPLFGRLVVFGLASIGFLVASAWVRANGYVNADVLRLWADVLMSWQSPDFAGDQLSTIYPQLRYYLAMAFYAVTGNPSGAGLSVFSALIGGLTAAVWWTRLRGAGWGVLGGFAVVVLLAAHPLVLWAVTRGGPEALGLFGFTLLAFALADLREAPGFRSEVTAAGVLAAYFFLDAGFIYLAMALLPALILFAPPRMVVLSPIAFFIVILLPLAAAVGAFFYVSWVFSGNALALLHDPTSAVYGAWMRAAEAPWLRLYGGEFWTPLAFLLMFGALAAPVVPVVALARLPRTGGRRALVVAWLVPIVAAALATAAMFVAHPAGFLCLVPVAAVIAARRVARSRATPLRLVVLLLLAVGLAGGWAVLQARPDPDTRAWQGALLGQPAPDRFAGERALAAFLTDGRETMIDDALGHPMIVARRSARDLVLPASDAFKLAITLNEPVAAQIAVPDPARPGAGQDQILQNFPFLYTEAPAGYRLVYDRLGWRVWRRSDL